MLRTPLSLVWSGVVSKKYVPNVLTERKVLFLRIIPCVRTLPNPNSFRSICISTPNIAPNIYLPLSTFPNLSYHDWQFITLVSLYIFHFLGSDEKYSYGVHKKWDLWCEKGHMRTNSNLSQKSIKFFQYIPTYISTTHKADYISLTSRFCLLK